MITIIIVFQMFNVQFPIALPNTPHSRTLFTGVCPLTNQRSLQALFHGRVVVTWIGPITLSVYYICVSATMF